MNASSNSSEENESHDQKQPIKTWDENENSHAEDREERRSETGGLNGGLFHGDYRYLGEII